MSIDIKKLQLYITGDGKEFENKEDAERHFGFFIIIQISLPDRHLPFNEMEKACLAGIFDGEGCLYISKVQKIIIALNTIYI